MHVDSIYEKCTVGNKIRKNNYIGILSVNTL